MKFIIFGFVIITIIIGLLYFNKKVGGNHSEKDFQTDISSPKYNLETQNDSLKKINSKDYKRYIFLKKTDTSYVLNMIKEFGELSGNEEYQIHRFWIAKHEDWKIVKLDKSINFYTYHNLAAWFLGYEENTNTPELSIGFARHETNLDESYIFYLDPNNEYGDTHIGVFNNFQSFKIYLPEAYEDYGNIILNEEVKLTMNQVKDFITKEGFDFSALKSSKFTEHQIKMYE